MTKHAHKVVVRPPLPLVFHGVLLTAEFFFSVYGYVHVQLAR